MLAAFAVALATTATRGTRWWRGFLGDEAVATGDHAADGFAGFGMLCEWLVFHALLHFETLWLGAGFLGNGFVDVGGHGIEVELTRFKSCGAQVRSDNELQNAFVTSRIPHSKRIALPTPHGMFYDDALFKIPCSAFSLSGRLVWILR